MTFCLLPTFCHQVLKSWSPGPKTSKSRISIFDLTLTSHVTSILSSLKSVDCVLWRALECRLARLSTTNGSRDSRGGGGVISPPGTEGCASPPTAFFNAHSHGIPEDFRDSRRLVTFPTGDDREFFSETGIPKLVPHQISYDSVSTNVQRNRKNHQNATVDDTPDRRGFLGIP